MLRARDNQRHQLRRRVQSAHNIPARPKILSEARRGKVGATSAGGELSRVIYAERRFDINRARFADALAKRDAQHATEKLLSNTLAERDAQHARDFSDLHSKMARDANLAQELSDVQAGNMQK